MDFRELILPTAFARIHTDGASATVPSTPTASSAPSDAGTSATDTPVASPHHRIATTPDLRTSIVQSTTTPVTPAAATDPWTLDNIIGWAIIFVVSVVGFLMLRMIVRFLYEVSSTKHLVYLRVTLPKADSKLDKERETKKDFKEKLGIMSIFYKGVHGIGESTFVSMVMNTILNSAKLSFELVYEDGQVNFYIITYRYFAKTVSQLITSNYPDAEVCPIDREKEYIKIKPAGYTLRVASIGKRNASVLPIRTFRYLEDDLLSNFTNAFGSLKRTDKAVYQISVKARGSSWNKKAKKAATDLAKGKYKGGHSSSGLGEFFGRLFSPLYWLLNRFVNNEETNSTSAPGASSGDSYKIFNQAETESHKAVGENAAQPAFRAAITILVSSDNAESADSGLQSLVLTTGTLADEYNNQLMNHKYEETMSFLFTPLRYFSFVHKLVGFWQDTSMYSCDELTTMFHFPDINYNKSPLIRWLEYKMLATPHNLKIMKEPLIMSDYKRDKDGNVATEDGSWLQVDKNKNLIRDVEHNFITVDGVTVQVHKEGPSIGKPIDAGKMPIQQDHHRTIQGFPLYHDGVLMGWNNYRNTKTPVYFQRKDRGRHHYIIGKSG